MIASKAESPVRAKFLRTRHCPNCGTSAHIPEVSSIPRGEDETWDQLSAAWRGFFKKKTFLTFARCSACGLLYAPNYFTDSALGALYGNMPDNTAGLSESYLEKTQRGYFRLLDRHSDWRGDYFELGPDTGLFTQFVAAKKKHGRLWLFEPNQAVHAELAKRGGGLEVSIRPEMKDFSAVPDGSIETCVMIHVLDHLPDAQIVLKSLRQKMAPGGKLLVVTHDERSLLARILKARWPAYCLQHSQLFNRQSTANFLSTCGFEVMETAKTVNYFPVSYLVKHLLYALGWHSLSARIKGDWLVIPLALGNIGTVARAKT